MQQVAKLAAVYAVETDTIMFIDSDVIFIKDFNPDHTMQDGKARLFRQEGAGNRPMQSKWHIRAAKLLGIEEKPYYGSGYISPLTCWHCNSILLLHKRIEETHKTPWQTMIYNSLHFSEYILYGIFVEHVLQDHEYHYYADTSLTLIFYGADSVKNGLDNHLKRLEPQHCALTIQSNLKLDPKKYIIEIEQYLNNKA